MYGRTDEEKKLRKDAHEVLLRYGKYLVDNTFDTKLGTYRVRMIQYEGYIYFHKMRNGELLELKKLAKVDERSAVDHDYAIYQTLMHLGFSTHFAGYPYVVESIRYALIHPTAFDYGKHSGYEVFTHVMNKFDINRENMRKCIDTVINNALDNITYQTASKYLGEACGFDKGRCTSIGVIAQITNYIKNEVLQ